MRLNDAYAKWKDSPSPENWEILGKSLNKYLPLFIRKYAGEYFPDTYEEAIGATFIKVFSRLPAFNSDRGQFSTWVIEIAKNTCYDITRDRRNEKLNLFNENVHGKVYDSIEDRLYVKQLVSRLRLDDQVLVRLKLDGFRDSEVAEKMGLTESAIKMRWYRIKTKIKCDF
jgi:RNA polymerase sigma-70 factor (ECF subfamily)